MSEAWRSTPRKYCDFCKCWIADNKISVSIHENGKGHKEAVQKKISSSHKASAKKEKEEAQAAKLFKIMERNANQAYKKDMRATTATDLTDSRVGSASKRPSGDTSISCSSKKQPKMETGTEKDDSEKNVYNEPDWYEFKSNSGVSYFVNVKTNESTWSEPENGTILKVYDNVTLSSESQQQQQNAKTEPNTTSTVKSIKSENQNGAFRDISHVHGYRSKEELSRDQPYLPYTSKHDEWTSNGSESKTGREMAYGSFLPVANQHSTSQQPIKLDLPEQTDNSHLFSHLPREAFEEEDPDDVLQLGEKKIQHEENYDDKYLSNYDGVKKEPGASSLFKKRKFGGGAKNRNIKQRDQIS